MADITDIISYYVNLLIIQYNGQPKAQATIQLFAQSMLASGIALDVQQAYDVDTAVGVQLDVIGKYVGIDRYYSQLNLTDYFSLETYAESAPTSPPRWGLSTYATFGNAQYNGTLLYGEIIAQNNALSDADFRTLIKFQILINSCNFSNSALDVSLFNSFGLTIRAEPNGTMSMVYFIQAPMTALIFAMIYKKLLPHPMAVGTIIVNDVNGVMFSFANYAGYESPYGYGFSTYANYGTLPGDILTYDQISVE